MARSKTNRQKKADEYALRRWPAIKRLLNEGFDLTEIATEFNAAGILTPAGLREAWTPMTVHRIIKRIERMRQEKQARKDQP